MSQPVRDREPARRGFLTSSIGKTAVIMPSAFLAATGIGVAALGLLFYVSDVLGASPAVTSMFSALWSFTYSISCILLRPVSSRLLPRHSLIIASSGMAATVLLIPITASLPAAFILYAVYGMSISFFWPSAVGWLSAGYGDSELNRKISYFNISWSIGTVVSPFIGGILFELSPIAPAYAAVGMFGATALLITAASILIPAIRTDIHREPRIARGDRSEDRSSKLRFASWAALIPGYFVFGILVNVFPLFVRGTLGLAEGKVGLLLLGRGLATAGVFFLLGRHSFWHFNRLWIAMTPPLIAVFTLLLVIPGTPATYFILLFLIGAVLGITYNNSVFHGIAGSPERAKRMSIHESVLTACVVAGSIIGGFLYERFSMQAVFLAAAGLAAIGTLPVGFLAAGARK